MPEVVCEDCGNEQTVSRLDRPECEDCRSLNLTQAKHAVK